MSADFTAYPLGLRPQLHRRLWGGKRLGAWFADRRGVELTGPSGEPVGEAWLVAPGSMVENGPLAGATLGELARSAGAALVGDEAVARYGARVPLLAKLLDADRDLSVQVHPGDAYAREHEAASGHLGKAEAWYFLECAPGASVLRGFEHDLTEAEARAALADGTFVRHLRRLPVKPGDVVANPAGTVHAVGAGSLLYEIQQASDLTYRLFDYGRLGADGRQRALQVDRALAVADLRARAPQARPRGSRGGWVELVDLPQFTLRRRALLEGEVVNGATEPRSLEVLVVTRGAARVEAAGRAIELERGGAAVLPASLGAYAIEGVGEVVLSALGGEA